MDIGNSVKLLYIDDEAHNLIGFKASLRLNYEVFTATDMERAYEILQQHPDMRIVFCDQRMPGKTGVEFFEEMRGIYPLPMRVLITGYADVESVIEAINRGHIFRYIKKPWTNSDLLSAIEEGNKFYITNSLLAARNEELRRAYNELDKFAYNVSHDIRSPITGILTGINMAMGLDDIEEVREALALMERSVKKLDSFILNMYDYYNLKMGELLITQINFENLINDQEDIYSVYANVHHVAFTTEIKQNAPFRSDEGLLKLIITNLLSNAFKYQRKGIADKEVGLSVVVDNARAVINVSDNGIGIKEKDMPEIFQLFFRSSEQEAGFGFGLYNIQNALNKLGGHVDVVSAEDEGTTFTIRIPNKL